MPLEVSAQVKEWLGEQVALDQHKDDEQASYTAVAVEEGMDGFELVVDEGDVQEGWQPCVTVYVVLQRAQGDGDLCGRWGNVGGLVQSCSGWADPVLYAAELSGIALLPSYSLYENGVHLSQETLGDRQLLQSPDAVLEGTYVVPDIPHVVLALRLAEERGLGLEGVEVDERGPCALDARGEDRLASEKGTGKQVRVREGPAQACELAQSPVGLRERSDERRPVSELRWKGGGHERPAPLPHGYQPPQRLG
jgi:hypothetical protein